MFSQYWIVVCVMSYPIVFYESKAVLISLSHTTLDISRTYILRRDAKFVEVPRARIFNIIYSYIHAFQNFESH